MRKETVGFALCGSFCTHREALQALERLCGEYERVLPIVSESCAASDTRFGKAQELMARLEQLTGNAVITGITAAEPIGPRRLLDVLVVAPCTGNTLGKLANGITDTTVTMAVKAHLRNDRPVVLSIATNDGLSGSAKNIGTLLARKNYYFVPFGQDDAITKPCSLIADLSRLNETVSAALDGKQLQPVLGLV